jgi:transposase
MRKQNTPADFGFDRNDKRRLRKALQTVLDKRTFLRLKAVLSIAQGMNINTVAEMVEKSVQIIYYWIRTYVQSHDPASLFDAPKPGRPLSAGSITAKQILRELKRDPLRLGYNTTVWTVALLARHLSNRYGCDIRPRTLRRRMKQIGLRSKRPHYVYADKDPHRAQKKGL